MSVELVNKTSVYSTNLKDGQIAVILTSGPYQGIVVQRYGKELVAIGKSWGCGWLDHFQTNPIGKGFEIRILQDGELIKVVNNGY